MTPNMDEGYQDGLHGRINRECSPNYYEGWKAGWRARMMAWGRVAQPADALAHDAEERS